jgi:anhydro-N-acetylmuramic acid kinase
MTKKIQTAIGLMSGTSIDGIDVSLIKSDGEEIQKKKLNNYYPYDKELKNILRNIINKKELSLQEIKEAELKITEKHIIAVENFIEHNNLNRKNIDLIGFSGHTILHDPKNIISWQIGNAQLLASKTKINVVADFRIKDVINNGQGAPLVPIYHHSLFLTHKNKPIIILNIGGVSNITYLKDNNINNIIACDICFGNAPMDDLVYKFNGGEFDRDGEMAKSGEIDHELAEKILKQEYFNRKPPKSLDRNHFHQILNEKLLSKFNKSEISNILKTICYVIVKSLEIEIKRLETKPEEIIVCGGGRNNDTIMEMLQENFSNAKVTNIDDFGFDGNFIESQAFAFLAIRKNKNLPITFKNTTGISIKNNEENISFSGGVIYQP